MLLKQQKNYQLFVNMTLIRDLLCDITKKLKKRDHDNAERDAVLILSHGLNLSMLDFYMQQQRSVDAKDILRVYELLSRRLVCEPISKIINKKFFYNSSFYVDESVLDPRPETELIVESVLENKENVKTILDLGTGSGCIAISLALELSEVIVVGSDISDKAIDVASFNSKKNNANVTFVQSDWFKNITTRFDIIVSNPPYVSEGELACLPDEVKNYDPKVALNGGKDGLNGYRKIAESLNLHLNIGGLGIFEIGFGQVTDVRNIFSKFGFSVYRIKCDLNGIERVICVKKDA